MPDKKLNLDQKRSVWVRSTIVGLVAIYIAVAIASLIIQENTVDGCARNGTFKNAEADNWEQASIVRRKAGDAGVADTYLKNAQVIRETIPMPDGWQPKSKVRVDLPNGKVIFVTDQGEDSSQRMEGCKQAYPDAVPFI